MTSSAKRTRDLVMGASIARACTQLGGRISVNKDPARDPARDRRAGNRPSESSRMPRPPETCSSDLELLQNGRDRDDMPLELQLGFLEAGRDADELRQVEDRHLEV